MNQEELAQAIGIGKATVSQYETCERTPRFDIMLKIIDFFDESVEYMMGATDQRRIKKIAK